MREKLSNTTNKEAVNWARIGLVFGGSFLIGGGKEYWRQRKEIVDNVDSKLPLWKREFTVIKEINKRDLLFEATKTGTLTAFAEIQRQRRLRTIPSGPSFAFA